MNDLQKLYELLSDICPDVDFENEKNLIEDGLIASLDLVTIVNEIMDAFGVELTVDDLVPENFNSAECMMRMIRHKEA